MLYDLSQLLSYAHEHPPGWLCNAQASVEVVIVPVLVQSSSIFLQVSLIKMELLLSPGLCLLIQDMLFVYTVLVRHESEPVQQTIYISSEGTRNAFQRAEYVGSWVSLSFKKPMHCKEGSQMKPRAAD